MKLSKTTWIALIIGVIVIAGFGLGWTYTQQNNQQKQLDNELAQANQRLNKITLNDLNTQKAQLTQQLEQINTQTEDTKTKLSSSKDSIDATDAILGDAKSHDIDITDISSSGISSGNLGAVTSQTLSINIKVEGNVQNIASFAISLSQIFPTAVVKTVQMEKLAPTPTPTTTPTPTDTPTPSPTPTETPPPPGFTPVVPPVKDFSASISLIIYNYEGK